VCITVSILVAVLILATIPIILGLQKLQYYRCSEITETDKCLPFLQRVSIASYAKRCINSWPTFSPYLYNGV